MMILSITSSVLAALAPLIIQGQHIINDKTSDILYNIHHDKSLQRFVGPNDPLTDIGYIPDTLEPIPHTWYLSPSHEGMSLHHDALEALLAMAESMHRDIGQTLTVVSAYRSYDKQHRINQRYGADEYRAKAGHSEHQLGLAVDLMGLNNATIQSDPAMKATYERLTTYAHLYGYTQSYQKGANIDGYHEEKRHRRYVGVAIATYLWEHGMTYTEFVKNQKGSDQQ